MNWRLFECSFSLQFCDKQSQTFALGSLRLINRLPDADLLKLFLLNPDNDSILALKLEFLLLFVSIMVEEEADGTDLKVARRILWCISLKESLVVEWEVDGNRCDDSEIRPICTPAGLDGFSSSNLGELGQLNCEPPPPPPGIVSLLNPVLCCCVLNITSSLLFLSILLVLSSVSLVALLLDDGFLLSWAAQVGCQFEPFVRLLLELDLDTCESLVAVSVVVVVVEELLLQLLLVLVLPLLVPVE